MLVKFTGIEGDIAIDGDAVIEVRSVAEFPHVYGKARSLIRRKNLGDVLVQEDVGVVLARLEAGALIGKATAAAEPTPAPQPTPASPYIRRL